MKEYIVFHSKVGLTAADIHEDIDKPHATENTMPAQSTPPIPADPVARYTSGDHPSMAWEQGQYQQPLTHDDVWQPKDEATEGYEESFLMIFPSKEHPYKTYVFVFKDKRIVNICYKEIMIENTY